MRDLAALQEQIVELGAQCKDEGLSDDERKRRLETLRRQYGLSHNQMRRAMERQISHLKHGLDRLDVQRNYLNDHAKTMREAMEAATDDAIPVAGLIAKFREAFPDAWVKVDGRTYKNADAYGNYRLAYLEWGWATALYDLKAEDGEAPSENLQDVIDTFNLHKEHGFPFFFVSKGICDAAWQSDLKFTVDWKTMRLPYEAFTFVLPKDNPVGYEAIIVYRKTKDGEMKFILSGLGKAALGRGIEAEFPFESTDEPDNQSLRWVFNTIYAMSARPEYVEGGERVGTRKGTQSEIWTPNVIGRKYAVKAHSFSNTHSGGVRLHWRRGHFRQQAVGVGRTQRKVIWIEPMMVGGAA